VTVRDIDRGFRRIVREFRSANLEAAAGYPVGTKGSLASEGTPIWQYMLYNEEGTSTIPSRPFMQTAFDDNVEKYERMTDEGLRQIVTTRGSLRNLLTRVAVEMHNDIKRSIATGDFEDNSEATIERKGSSRPLFDTGAALSAVAFEVRTPRNG
jgi:hypothetical protein